MKIRHKLLFCLISIFAVLLVIILTVYQASLRVDFFRQRSEFLSGQLSKLTSLRAQVRNQILETYEVVFVEGMKTNVGDIEVEREQVKAKFAELEKLLSSNESEINLVKNLRADYTLMDQELAEGAHFGAIGKIESAKLKILSARENRFNNGFLKRIKEAIDTQKKATLESGENLAESIYKLKELLLLFAVLVAFLTVGFFVYLSKSISDRLMRLETATHRISEGNLDIFVKESGHDEVSVLSRAFNHMMMSLREARARLQQQQEIVTQSSKMSALGEMAGGIAHEINTPLAIIQMRADQLLECINENSLDKEFLKSALTAIDQTVRRISKIVNGLRSFARDGTKDPLAPYSAFKIVEETFTLCQERFRNNNVSLEFKPRCEDVEIMCRPSEISQVLLNLLNNSFDAIQEFSERWVKVELKIENESILFLVVDSGTGIPKEIQDKMMQPFFTTKDIGKGTGLGLSISKGIIESHSGYIEIDNTQKNTTFVLRFPARKNSDSIPVAM